jgi:uncharacterized membrane protein
MSIESTRSLRRRAAFDAGRFLVAAAAAVLLATTAPAGVPSNTDTDIDVRASKDGETVVVDVDMTVQATQDEVWSVLTDYEHMARFVSNLESSAIISRTGDTLDVMQKGTARYGLLSFPFETVRRVQLTPRREIRSRIMSGDMMGSEIVTRITADGSLTQVSVHSRYVPTIWIPPVIGPSVIASETRKQWTTLRDEVLRRRERTAPQPASLREENSNDRRVPSMTLAAGGL